MQKTDDQEKCESAPNIPTEAVDPFALRLETDAKQEREERYRLELERQRDRARPSIVGPVKKLLEQRYPENRDEIDGQDAEQRRTSKHVERFYPIRRGNGNGRW